MRTQYYTASSLDGFIADAHDSLEWLFPRGDVMETSFPTRSRQAAPAAEYREPAGQAGVGPGGRHRFAELHYEVPRHPSPTTPEGPHG